jgi:hypothetical protein
MTKLFEILDGVRPSSQSMLDEILSIHAFPARGVIFDPL